LSPRHRRNFPEDLFVGWVPPELSSKAAGWVAEMNQRLKVSIDIKHRRDLPAAQSILVQFDDLANLPVGVQSYDLTRLDELNASERATVTARFVERARAGDWRAIVSLGQLDSPEAVDVLESFVGRNDMAGKRARQAMAQLGRGAAVDRALAADAAEADNWPLQFAALVALAKVRTPMALGALVRMLNDPNKGLRRRALRSAFDLLSVTDRELRSGHLARQLESEDRAVAAAAAGELAAILDGLQKAAW
jgi:HEAT repeat protein